MNDELYKKMAELGYWIEDLTHTLIFVAKKVNQSDIDSLSTFNLYVDIKKAVMNVKYWMEQISVMEKLEDGITIQDWFYSTYGYNVPSDYSLWKAYKTLGVLGDD